MFGKLQSLMVEGRQEVPHTETETDRTKETQAKLKTSALGSVEQLEDSVKEGFLEEGVSGLAKKKGVEMAWGRKWSRLLRLWPGQRAGCKCQAEQRNEENHGCMSRNGG